MASVRVVLQNLWGRRGDWEARRAVLAERFRELRPDLVVFVEAVVTDAYDQVVDLLGGEYHILHQRAREPGDGEDVERGQGHSLASRWPLGEVRELDLHVTPRTEGFACGALAAEVLAPEPIGPLVFASHLPSWKLDQEHEREQQAVAAARFLDELARRREARHVVMAGDLDADPESASVRFWTGRQSLGGMSVCYRDAWESVHPAEPGHTFTPETPIMIGRDWPFRRIDYVFVRCGEHEGPTLEIVDCRRLFDGPVNGVWASDHFGLCVDLCTP
ncbi:MAG TPA: endonuclease/exonuclease/phosphatase family protein [Acidimicrobiia bacterium]|jgi:endonuclease/exonuclease/phosphatase family metal-dependent hydrolase